MLSAHLFTETGNMELDEQKWLLNLYIMQYVQCTVSFLLPTLSQSCIDWNRDVLKRELGLDDEDIIDLPILFELAEDTEDEYRAVAYYPDMVCLAVNWHMTRL